MKDIKQKGNCPICNCKLIEYDIAYNWGKDYDFYESTIEIASDDFVSIRAGKDKNNKTSLIACGDSELFYYPKYCPECGRKLHN